MSDSTKIDVSTKALEALSNRLPRGYAHKVRNKLIVDPGREYSIMYIYKVKTGKAVNTEILSALFEVAEEHEARLEQLSEKLTNGKS